MVVIFKGIRKNYLMFNNTMKPTRLKINHSKLVKKKISKIIL